VPPLAGRAQLLRRCSVTHHVFNFVYLMHLALLGPDVRLDDGHTYRFIYLSLAVSVLSLVVFYTCLSTKIPRFPVLI
jgi:hypothetical protein